MLALEDARGAKSVIMSFDLLGITKGIYQRTCLAVKEKLGIPQERIMMNASHSHCTPVLANALYDVYVDMPPEQIPVIERYTATLEATIVDTTGAAFAQKKKVNLFTGSGTSRFAVNRRNNDESLSENLRQRGKLKGPVDHSVPVIAFYEVSSGNLCAVIFGYACHNTVLNFYQWCGDYSGFAQIALERNHPGCTSFFFMGCGADQNPLPRRQVVLAQRYGEMLAAAVEEALLEIFADHRNPICAILDQALEYAELKYERSYTREEMVEMAEVHVGDTKSYKHHYAERMLNEMASEKPFSSSYPCPILAWHFGEKSSTSSLLWIATGGEAVVDYSLGFKAEFGRKMIVSSYCNDVFGYIPSHRVWSEDKIPPLTFSCYEGAHSMMVYGHPATRWFEDVEFVVSRSVRNLVLKVTSSGT